MFLNFTLISYFIYVINLKVKLYNFRRMNKGVSDISSHLYLYRKISLRLYSYLYLINIKIERHPMMIMSQLELS